MIINQVWSKLWQWAARRHPEKGARWVKRSYFKTIKTGAWVFAATIKQKDGTKKELILRRASDAPIKRHVKIKADANPHEPECAEYFERRGIKQLSHSAKGLVKLVKLVKLCHVWSRQDCVCPTCQEPITKDTSWEVRYIVKEIDGGCRARRQRGQTGA